MSDLTTTCEECGSEFDPRDNAASAEAITLAGTAVGALGGGKVGIALGPHGAIAGTIPGAIVGGIGGHLIDRSWVTCPECKKTKLL